MFESVETFLAGSAAVVDTALLLPLLERRNWRYALLPAVVLLFGVWFWHCGVFAQLLLLESTGAWAGRVRSILGTGSAVGLLLLPGALLHGVLRLKELAFPLVPRFQPRRLLVHLPAALCLGGVIRGANDTATIVYPLAEPVGTIYAAWLSAVCLHGAIAMRGVKRESTDLRTTRFCTLTSVALGVTGVAGLAMHLAASSLPQEVVRELRLAVFLLPLLPSLVFAVFVVRYNVLGLVIERTFVYGALVVGVLLFHRIAVAGLTDAMADRYRVDFGLVEGVAVLALILAYQPFRRRSGEALRYLLGSGVPEERSAIRRLCRILSRLSSEPPEVLLSGFVEGLREVFGAAKGHGWLLGPRTEAPWRCDAPGRPEAPAPVEIPADTLRVVFEEMGEATVATRTDPCGPRGAELLAILEASVLLKLREVESPGLVALGRRRGNREYSPEEQNALVLLTEQLAGALRASRLQLDRLAAEHRALQSEKLSSLGLLASSIAHEVKNPLSSMKTIATILAEELGPGTGHARDLQLLLEQIDRLSLKTTQLLEFARPARNGEGPISLGGVVERHLLLLRHLARQKRVELTSKLDGNAPPLRADESGLAEIVFNLLQNAIEAASRAASGAGGVEVAVARVEGGVELTVRDNGPGIPPEIRERLFQPFVTTRPDGTGLGLHTVSRRVKELRGEVSCSSSAAAGTVFTVRFPLEAP